MTTPNPPSGSSSSDIQSFKVDSNHSGRPLWLVKVPKYLATAWEKTADEQVGEITITKAGDGKLDIALRIKDSIIEGDIPRNYDLPLTNVTAQKMAVIAQNKTSSTLAMDGHVNRRADIRPSGAGGKEYMNMKKAQIKLAIAPTRTAMRVDRVVNYKPVTGHVKRNIVDEKETSKVEKKLRGDKEVVTERLFAAFEKHQYINIRDLVNITNQPIQYLKEILNEICDYNAKNPHKNMWELKPQFRHY